MVRDEEDYQNVVTKRQKEKGRIKNAQQERAKISNVQKECEKRLKKFGQGVLWTSGVPRKQTSDFYLYSRSALKTLRAPSNK